MILAGDLERPAPPGADRQYDDKFVFGLFVDYTRHNAEYEISLRLEDIFSGRLGYEIEDELSIGGRVGYLLTPATMLFGSVGYSHLWLGDTTASFQIDDGPGGSGVLADNGSFGGVFLGAVAISVGILNAACMTY